ncbi:MAG TPA: hypothetical protein EYP90_05290, partial [Chromatiaceae bacterium]|nr:hypothetical protein [Chromatiaceae bacterium]
MFNSRVARHFFRFFMFYRLQGRSLQGVRRPPQSNDVCVSYGFRVVPGKDRVAGGGIVKLQDLQDVFPNRFAGADILYLVSSALPPYAVALARHARRRGVSIVLNQNGTAYPAWFGSGWQKANRPMQELVRMADYVLYQSRFCKMAADLHLGTRSRN